MTFNEIMHLYENNLTCFDYVGSKKEGIHSIGKYPATMVAPMQYQILQSLVEDNPNFEILLDNFMGSGTSLIEGQKLGLNVIGIDINPYAVLLSTVKTNVYCINEIESSIERVFSKLDDNFFEYGMHDFFNINKWFKQEAQIQLSKIREAIILETNKTIRLFFWVCMSEVIQKYSNDRTSTFKLHAKKEEDILNLKIECISYFKKIVKRNKEVLNYVQNTCNVEIIAGDSLEKILNINNESVDIICTSPPYGDNDTTVTYGQFSILFLKWFLLSDLNCSEDMISTYSKIDKISLGGGCKERDDILLNLYSLNNFVSSISQNKTKKVVNFFIDYYLIMEQMIRVLKRDGYLMMTVGNRQVDGVEQPLNDITIEIAELFQLSLVSQFERSISNKSMPWKVSNIKGIGAVSSMKKEYVLIFRK